MSQGAGLVQPVYQPLGNLWLTFPHSAYDTNSYRRSLDLDRAVGTVQYRVGSLTFAREVFSSYPDQVIVVRVSADRPRQVHFAITADSPLRHLVAVEGGNVFGGARARPGPCGPGLSAL